MHYYKFCDVQKAESISTWHWKNAIDADGNMILVLELPDGTSEVVISAVLLIQHQTEVIVFKTNGNIDYLSGELEM